MPVQMNKYKDPRDGSICVMPNSAEKVETKHGTFTRVSADADNKTAPSIVPVTAQSSVSAGGAVRVTDKVATEQLTSDSPVPSTAPVVPSAPPAPAKPMIFMGMPNK